MHPSLTAVRFSSALALCLSACLMAATAAAQAPYPVGVRDLSLPNTTGQGSASLTARVHYPAQSAGTNQPVLPRAGGWPVVVFLHGFAALGSFYGALGDGLAAAGYVAVMSNTAQFDNVGQERDGRALFPALVAAQATTGGPLQGALDVARIGLAGHSMGGGNVGNVLAGNPGYRCGFALAPVPPRGSNAAAVTVPIGIAVGTGDTVTPWQTNSQPFFQGLTNHQGLASMLLLGADCNHTNVAGLGTGTIASEVFQSVLATALGFFDRWLGDDPRGLESVAGASARAEPRLVSLQLSVAHAEVWTAGDLRPGATARLSVAAEPGLAGALAAAAPGLVATPLGELLLDPATAFVAVAGIAGAERRVDAPVVIPNDPAFAGARVHVQAFGATRTAPLALGAATELVVAP